MRGTCQGCNDNNADTALVLCLTCAIHASDHDATCPGCEEDGFEALAFPMWTLCEGYCPACIERWEDEGSHEANEGAPTLPLLLPPRATRPTPVQRAEVNGGDRARNVRDMAKLREWYPKHCTHHLFYHHVLGRQGGCRDGAAPHCTVGGKDFLHERPRDLNDYIGRLEVAT